MNAINTSTVTLLFGRHAHYNEEGHVSVIGRREIREAGREMVALKCIPDTFLNSPVLRAMETSELLISTLEPENFVPIQKVSALSDFASFSRDRLMDDVLAPITSLPDTTRVCAIVSHDAPLGYMLSFMENPLRKDFLLGRGMSTASFLGLEYPVETFSSLTPSRLTGFEQKPLQAFWINNDL